MTVPSSPLGGTVTRLGRAGGLGTIPDSQEGPAVWIDFGVALHVFMSVLVMGTLWRVIQYHLMASPNAHAQHVGKAMSTQY